MGYPVVDIYLTNVHLVLFDRPFFRFKTLLHEVFCEGPARPSGL